MLGHVFIGRRALCVLEGNGQHCSARGGKNLLLREAYGLSPHEAYLSLSTHKAHPHIVNPDGPHGQSAGSFFREY